MRKERIHNPLRVVFSRWSRKAYAVFASLGKEVTIGHVAVAIADSAYAKSCYLNVAEMDVRAGDAEDESSPEKLSLLSELEIMFSNLLETLIFVAVSFKKEDNQPLAVNDINYGESRVPALWESGSFRLKRFTQRPHEKTRRTQSFIL